MGTERSIPLQKQERRGGGGGGGGGSTRASPVAAPMPKSASFLEKRETA